MNFKSIALFGTILCLSAQGADMDCFKSLAKYHYGDPNQAGTNALALIIATPADQLVPVEAALLEALAEPSATPEGRAFLCRILQRIGSDQCIPAVAGLLHDEVLADYAVAILERIGTPPAAAAIRKALDQAPDKVKPGLMGSLGVLRDVQAVEPIARLAASANPLIASSAIRALGKIGGETASQTLLRLTVPEPLQHDYRLSLLTCAQSLSDKSAGALYEAVLASKDPTCSAAALDGMLRVDPAGAIREIKDRLKASDDKSNPALLALIAVGKGGDALIQAVGGSLGEMPAEVKSKWICALGSSRNPQALPFINANLADTNAAVRSATLEALGEMGTPAELKPLLALEDPAAVKAIGQMTAPGIDAALIELVKTPNLVKPVISALVARNTVLAVPGLLEVTGNADPAVRASAWSALKSIAYEEQILPLSQKAFAVTDSKDQAVAFAAIKSVCATAVNKDKCFEPVLAAYESGTDPVKQAILDVGGKVGTAKALELEKRAIQSGNGGLASKAIKALSGWPDKSVAPYLLELVGKAAQDADKLTALQGYIQIACNEDVKMSGKDRCEMLKKATALATRPDEKLLIVGGLNLADGPDFYPLLTQYIQDPQTRVEGERTGLEILTKMKKRNTPDAQALAKLLATSTNSTVSEKAKKLIEPAG